MSLFRYNSRHKIITFVVVIIAAAVGYYLNQRALPTFENGQPKRAGSLVDGRNQGHWSWYYPNGRMKMEGDFDGGKRTGRWITYSPNGDTLTVSFYRDDKLNGPHTEFGTDGRPAVVTTYANDLPVSAAGGH